MDTFLGFLTVIGLLSLNYVLERVKVYAIGRSYVHGYRRSDGTNVRAHSRKKKSTW